jgi:class 3 adenylate cyclase
MYVKNARLTLTQKGDSTLAGRRVDVIALFCDLRGFSNWCETVDITQVEQLMRSQFERVIQICNDHHHDFHKFLGDGFVLVWEASEETPISTCLARAVDAAFHLHKKYWFLSAETEGEVPPGYGIGIAVGEAVLLQPKTFIAELNEIDFVGYPLNCAARLQTLAGAYGTVLSAAAVDMMKSDNGALLYEAVPAFHRLLVPADDGALGKAAVMKGLRDRDRVDFQFLVFEAGYTKLWKTMGIHAAQ